ncbi:MAG: hypothetical protein NHG36_19980 [Chromatiaceae bacterium]|nr:hypothetical protein [Candidatus Thioaporhodococcus sediminis]
MKLATDMFLAVEWSMTPNGIAHVFDYWPAGLAMSVCRSKLRELSMLTPAKPDAVKCKKCLKLIGMQ